MITQDRQDRWWVTLAGGRYGPFRAYSAAAEWREAILWEQYRLMLRGL